MTDRDNLERIVGLYVRPSPWKIRPSATELERFRRFRAGKDDLDKLVAAWQGWPGSQRPGRWASGRISRRLCAKAALHGLIQTVAAGDVVHTVMRRGSVETRKIHTFNDSGDVLVKMVEDAHHPLGLAQACHCTAARPTATAMPRSGWTAPAAPGR